MVTDRPRVVVTRARAQAGELSQRLRDHGFEPVEVPVIEVVAPRDGGAALADAAARLDRFDWVVLTSVNGARRLLDAAPAPWPASVRVAAIGPGTATALRDRGVDVTLLPERFVAESLLDALPDPPLSGGRVLLARAEVARDVLPDGLRARGWDVVVVDAYRTIAPEVSPSALDAIAGAEVVAFTSPSTVHHFVDLIGVDALPPVVVSIGPVTSAAARDYGIDVSIEAAEHSIPGLVGALVARWAHRSGGGDPR
jgi:uroporphyrinogen-III synthase